ncbi:hypothetical protein TNIN_191741 [Trichonephila inaurata madagascariensis]|uniref:Uncharacterized protein n=1 Tax=Trichonephila inaurata madagascariensis TaxID=2747483 RepID=A0A8X6K2Y0_9ARAC|nr:hypothetical protein TNIN_191741 [Trichonephila inaurata madagascariensis]
MRNQLIEQPDLLSKIEWRDEACFKLSGYVNRHNSVCWAEENTHVIMTTQLYHPGVTVWGGISCDGVMGSVLFDGTVDRSCGNTTVNTTRLHGIVLSTG